MLDNFISNAIIITEEPLEKEEALEMIVLQLCRAYNLPLFEEIIEKIIERESRLSTGIGLGIAVPHCKIKNIDQIYLGVLLNRMGMEYNSVDQSPVKLMFLIVSPDEDYEGHIKCLSLISKAAADEVTRLSMLNAQNEDSLYRILAGQFV